ncbi:MAG TPA: alpha/beta fold hydrolase [Stellaceae bacterium]|nr:alpha/beta fold hydrolase [Stellaceae bacterium]
METIFHRDKRTRPPVRRLWTEAMSAVTPMPRQVILAAARIAPTGDGHPVLLVPGFLRGERYMAPLRRFLEARGYVVYGWRLGVNIGPTERVVDGVERRLIDIVARHDRAATVIGHSLGGALVRELAKERPALVRQVIVLASPIRLPTASPFEPLYRMLSRWHSPDTRSLYARINEPPPVPVTAIYIRSDGIVAWQSCLEAEGPGRENIEIKGPHSTMARNPAAWRVIADRLAQQEGAWRPYGTGRG